MKVCVYGAGAIGGHLAARLAKGGADVSVVARGAHLAAIQANGIRIHAPDGEIHAKVHASADPAELGPQDAVIVTVKAPALPAVAAGIAPLLRPDTPVVFAMNGIPWFYFHREGGPDDGRRLEKLDPADALWNAVGPERAIAGVVYSACTVTAPGEIHVENARSRLIIGEPDGTKSARTEALADLLRAGGLTMEVTDRIRDMIWSKLLLNLGSGPLAVLTGSAPGRFYTEDPCCEATRGILAEGTAIAEALGCRVSPDADGQIRNGRKSQHKPSILQDLERGRPMEIDALYTVPLDLARMRGVPTPLLDLLVGMTRARAREAGLY
ncbi:MAG: 2-dehydropantoate 2-reductase [Acetobacteraceae bacterium]